MRIYIEQYEADPQKVDELPAHILKELTGLALELCKLQEFTHRTSPTVIT